MLGQLCYFLLIMQSFVLSAYGEKSSNVIQNISVSFNYNENKINNNTNAEVADYINSTMKDLTHIGRENLNEGKMDDTSSKSSHNTNKVKNPLNYPIQSMVLPPVYDSFGEKNDGKPIVPKKGVMYNMSDIASSYQIPLTSTLISNASTGRNETKIYEPSILAVENKTTKSSLKPLQVDEMKIGRRSNIVLPVIAVILSIPLIGILIVVFYKRGAEWWQHRHYRRMDFLIDGMYNN